MENELKEHFVDFNKYCPSCKYRDLEKNDNQQEPEPCNECLTEPVNLYSTKPVKYKKDEKIKEK